MTFLEKNINLFLLLLVMGIAVVVAGTSMYYQSTFTNVTSRLDITTNTLNTCSADLDNTKFRLNKTLASLNFTVQDIRRYDLLYENKTGQLVLTERNLQETARTLDSTKTKLGETAELYQRYLTKYDEQKAINDDLLQQVSDLESIKSSQAAQIISLNSKVNKLQEEKTACGCT
ncbi:hypothetical protein HZB03_02705 [Candidatus Woesearchaeota archaeon]|nr:hypothetical protein [Candidatus Woesearchaeota archaeon]